MPLSLEQFEAQLAASGLIPADEVRRVRAALPAADAEPLARELVRQKLLTAFQAQQCFAGKGKSLVLGNYVLLDKLGQGGMGMVLKAQHKRMKRIVALKVLAPNVAKNQELVARFQREVEAAARLTHPNIVAAYDADEANGTVFLVMEFVAGSDLSSLVKKSGPLPLAQAVQCVLQAARGLEYAHRQGVIHRDIKPANLLLDQSGVVKILDMGLARIEGDTSGKAELTSTGAVMGTVDYMAPEQALSTKHADARSDIYSLGVSLWYLLAGKPLFDGDSLMARLIAHREFSPPSLCDVRADVPPVLNALFQRMVAKKTADRPQTMTDVITVLESIQRGDSTTEFTPAPQPSDDSKFSAFLSNLGDTAPTRATTPASLAARKSLRVDAQSEATVTSSDGNVPTDPQTLTVAPPSGSNPGGRVRRAIQSTGRTRSWWRNRRVQGGGAAGVALLVLVAFAFRGSSPDDPAPPVLGPSTVAANAVAALPGDVAPSPVSGRPADAPPAVPNYALSLDGTTGGLVIPQLDYRGDYPLTVEGWVKLPRVTGEQSSVFGHWFYSPLFAIDHDRGRHGWFMQTRTEKTNFLNSLVAEDRRTGEWVHIAGTMDDRGQTLFINGHRVLSNPLDAPLKRDADLPNKVFLGDGPEAGRIRFQGLIDEVRISRGNRYRDDFTPERRLEVDANTLALYHFDEGAGDEIADASPAQRHIRMKDVPWGRRPDWVSVDAEAAASGDWIPLSNSRDPQAGWAALGPFHAVDGTLAATASGMAVSRETYGDFELELEWRVGPQGNAGVYYRTDAQAVAGQANYPGTELQLLDDGHFTGGKVAVRSTGALFGVFAPSRLAARAVGEWNSARIVARGSSVEHWINGERVVNYQIGSPEWRQALSALTNAGLRPNLGARSGHILLQSHGGEVAYRNVRIRRLQTAESPNDSQSEFALEFNSDDDIVVLPPLPINDLKQVTLEVVVEPAVSNPYLCYIASLAEIRIGIQSNILQFGGAFLSGAPSAGVFATGVDLQPYQPCCVAGVWDGDVTRLFVDGRLIGVNDAGESLVFGRDPEFTIGSANVQVRGEFLRRYFRGRIRELRFSRTARYTEDYDPHLPMTADADTIALYRFNEGQGDVLHDSSGHGYHGLITGASWVRVEPWRGPTVPKSQFVNLQSLLDLNRDRPHSSIQVGANNWSLKDGQLTYVTDGKGGRVTFPVDISSARDYEISFDVKRLSGATPFWVEFASAPNAWCALGVTVQGEVELKLANGQRVPIGIWSTTSNGEGRLALRVTRDAMGQPATVTVRVDRTPVGRWTGNLPATDGQNSAAQSGEMQLGLFCEQDPHEFSNLQLRVYDGTARVLGPPSPAATGGSPASSTAQPTIVALSELNTSDYNTAPWLSQDGLRLYWEHAPNAGLWNSAETMMASRPNVRSPFGSPTKVAAGRMATLSPDELELICVPGGAGGSLHVTRRAHVHARFPPLEPLSLPAGLQNPKSPCILFDGLRLIVQDSRPGGSEVLQATRASRTAAWQPAVPIDELSQVARGVPVTWPFVSDNRLQIWYGHGGDRATQIWTGTRRTVDQSFGNFQPVLVDGRPLVGRAPRYRAITRELYFSRPIGENGWELAVVRNYVPASSPVTNTTPPRPTPPAPSPSPAPPPAAVGASEWMDVLPLIDPSLDAWTPPGKTTPGGWRIEGGDLVVDCGDGAPATLILPLDIRGPAYECEIEFTRRAGASGFLVDLPAQKGVIPHDFDHSTKGKVLLGAPRLPSYGPCAIETGRRTKLTITAERAAMRDNLTLTFNGTTIGKWSGDREELAAANPAGYPPDPAISLSVYGGGHYAFHSIRLRMLGGGELTPRHRRSAADEQFALEFDGVDDYVDLTNDWQYDGGPLTFEAWVKVGPTRTTQGSHHLFVADFGADAGWHAVRFARKVDPDANGVWRRINASDPIRSIMTSVDDPLSEGDLVHLAAVWDGEQRRIFIDGRPGAEMLFPWQYRPRSVPPYAWLGAFQVGKSDGSTAASDSWSGQMWQARISAGALYKEAFQPQTELAPRSDTIALYRFQDGDGDLLRDSSGHNRHGRIVGPKWVRADKSELPGVVDREVAEWAIGIGGRVWWQGLPAEVKQLADLPSTPFQIRTLHIGNCKISDDDLRRAASLKDLVHLSLHNSGITDAGLKHLEGHRSLSVLQPYNCPITDASIPVLATLPLQSVNLGYTSTTGDGIAALARARPSIELWHITGLKTVNDDTLRLLATLPRIIEVDVCGTAVTSSGIAAILQAHPQAKVHSDVAAPGPTGAATQPAGIDLLSGVDLAKDGLVFQDGVQKWGPGGWTRVANGWQSAETGRSLLRLRHDRLPAAYRLTVEGIPATNRSALWTPLAFGDTTCFFTSNGFLKGESASAAFGYVDGQSEEMNATTRPHPAFKAGQAVRIELDVELRGDQVTLVASLDGREVTRYSGATSRLSLPPAFRNFYDGSEARFGVGSTGQFVVTRVTLQEKPVSATAP